MEGVLWLAESYKYCEKILNIPLYEIPYWEFDNLEKIIYNIIKEVNLLNE